MSKGERSFLPPVKQLVYSPYAGLLAVDKDGMLWILDASGVNEGLWRPFTMEIEKEKP